MQEAHTEWPDLLLIAKASLVSVVMITYNHERYLAEEIYRALREYAQ
jgi:hypothetical protein